MIIVTVSNITYNEELKFTDADDELSVTVKGHALFEEISKNLEQGVKKGENIICAAVSFAALTLLKSIKIIGDIQFNYTIEDGLLHFTVNLSELDSDRKKVLKILLEAFLIGLFDIRQKYQDFISINFI